jgi:hypothetical protein
MIDHNLLIYAGTVAIFLITAAAIAFSFLAVPGVTTLAIAVVRALRSRSLKAQVPDSASSRSASQMINDTGAICVGHQEETRTSRSE